MTEQTGAERLERAVRYIERSPLEGALDVAAALDGCVLLTASEQEQVRAQMAYVGADYADTAYGREVLAARALLAPSDPWQKYDEMMSNRGEC